MKKKKIIELQKMALESSTSENILLHKYVEKLLTDKENLQCIIDSIKEKNKPENETESEKDLKIENLKSIIGDCNTEIVERGNKISELKKEIEEYQKSIENLEIRNKGLNSVVDNKTLLIDKLDKQLAKLVYEAIANEKYIESLKQELEYYKRKIEFYEK